MIQELKIAFSRSHGRTKAFFGAIVAVALVALGFGIFAVAAPRGYWGDARRRGNYCEEPQYEAALRTSMNSWSNLSYVAAGGWCLGKSLQIIPSEQGFRRHVLLLLVGVTFVAVGVGSFLFHASLTRIHQQLDVAAMYWSMNACLAVTLYRWFCRFAPGDAVRSQCSLYALLFTLILVLAGDVYMYIYKWQLSASRVFTSQLVVVIASEFLLTFSFYCSNRSEFCRGLRLGITALICGIVGFIFREAGVWHRKRGITNSFCNPVGFFQPHALWHLLGGIALLLLGEMQLGVPFLGRSQAYSEDAARKESEPTSAADKALTHSTAESALGQFHHASDPKGLDDRAELVGYSLGRMPL
eukprot:TRINITY_DN25457_c0_g1_i1.p1 TRINITY_DN25457_c0_g1~~TRINITY_DN25457_c0_g1_i1.p1  ORF type:complete len:371 (+),score=30.73 TRINITY_DN25457_c0_g1_i1:48-1115(+)